MDNEELALIKKAQRGNILAFEALVKKYDRPVMQLALSMLNNTHDAEDIYQEIFVRVFRNLKYFQFRSEFSTWLYRVVVNTCINHQKKRNRRKEFFVEKDFDNRDDFVSSSGPDNVTNPEARLMNQELFAEIDAAIDCLSNKQKTVFLLRHYHGHKLKEIAEIMNCSEGTVKNYLFRATQKLQKLLKKYAKV